MYTFLPKMVLVFFTAFGIMLGASLMGSLAALLVGEPPGMVMLALAKEIKVWAIIAAIGGSFLTLEVLESGVLQGNIRGIMKQGFFILSGFAGAHVGYFVVVNLCGGNR